MLSQEANKLMGIGASYILSGSCYHATCPTARTNHFDMPLTPGTEVQVAFIDGNPDRPYIQCALENSTSLITPVSNENPHHAAILTDGMLKTEALKSRQSLHISGQHSAKEVKAFISSDENKIFEYDSRGKRLNEKIVPEEGKHHIEERYGDRYVRTYGADFIHGMNAVFRFGHKYEEIHAGIEGEFQLGNRDVTKGKLLADETCLSGPRPAGFRTDKEYQRGIVTKEFGNKYNYHKGYESVWLENLDKTYPHRTFRYGSQLTQHYADINSDAVSLKMEPPSGLTFENLKSGNTDYYHDNRYQIVMGQYVEMQEQGYKLTRNGNTEETRTGNVTSTTIGNVTESISGGAVEIKNELDGKTVTEMMPAGDYKTEITAMNYETMFMLNGEHKVMDISTKKTVI